MTPNEKGNKKRENEPSLPSDRNEAFEKEIQRSDSVRRETVTTTTKHQRKSKEGKKQRQTRRGGRQECKRELVPAFASSQCINNKLPSHMFTRSYERVDCKRELVPAFTSSQSINNTFPSHLFTPFSMSSQVSKTRRTSYSYRTLCFYVLTFSRSHLHLSPFVRQAGYFTRVFEFADSFFFGPFSLFLFSLRVFALFFEIGFCCNIFGFCCFFFFFFRGVDV